MRYALVLFAVALAACAGCYDVTVTSHHELFAPTTYTASDGDVTVDYYGGQCSEAKRVLDTLAARANRGCLQWSRMAESQYRDSVLAATCTEL